MSSQKSQFFNFFNLLFVKRYTSGLALDKMAKERILYYEMLDPEERNAFDRGLIFTAFNSSFLVRKWKRGQPVGNGPLTDTEISIVVDKLIRLHNLSIADMALPCVFPSRAILEWFDRQAGISLLPEWERLQERFPERECIVHGDFQPKKHLIRSGHGLTIIDYGDAFLGQPSVDLGAIALSHPYLFESFFTVYNERAALPVSRVMADFWKKYFATANAFWV